MSDEGDMSPSEWTHHKLTRNFIMVPFIVLAPKPGSNTTSAYRLDFTEGELPLSSLTPEHVRVRNLYNKDCAVYLGASLTWSGREKLYEDIYFEWFPHRDREQDLKRGSFFAAFFSGESLQYDPAHLASFHFGPMCSRLKELLPDVLEKEPMRDSIHFGKPRQPGLFKMRRSFEKTFLIVDQKEWKNGVCVVTMDERIARELGGAAEELEVDVEGPKKVMVLRATLKSAMKAVVADDVERRKENREWSGYYGKWCGGDDEGPPTRDGDFGIGMSVEEYHRTQKSKVES